MKLLLPLLLVAITSVCIAQKTQVKYYKSRPFEEEVSQEKAKFSETTVEENGVTTVTVKDLKKDEMIYAHRGDEPIGVWGSGLDFDFQVIYANDTCKSNEDIAEVKTWFRDDPSLKYRAPLINEKDNDLYSFIRKNLRYPAKARREGIDGTVELAFTITEEGKIENIVVIKGVHIVLDKEAVRLIRSMKLLKPATLNGKPTKVCAKFPLKYKLA
jgi:TonB family protein